MNLFDRIMPRAQRRAPSTPINRADSLSRLNYKSANFNIPKPKRVEELPQKVANELVQFSSTDSPDGTEVEVKSGRAEAGSSAGWYEVTFDDPFIDGTQVVVNANSEERRGEFSEGEYDNPEHDAPEGGSPGTPGVSISDISISKPTIDSQSVDAVGEVGDYGVGSSGVSSQSVEGGEVSEPGLEGISGDVSSVEVGQVGVTAPSLDHQSKKPSFSFENSFKSQTRQAGSDAYDFIADAIDSYIPNIPGVNIRGGMKDFFNEYLNIMYGEGRTNNGGEGFAESAYGFVGSLIDDALTSEFAEKADEQLELGRRTDGNFDVQSKNVEDALQELTDDLNSQIDSLRTDVQSDLRTLDSDIDGVANELRSNINVTLDNLVSDINSRVDDLASQTDEGLSQLSDETDTQFSTLSSDINSQLTAIDEDINKALQTIAEQTNAALEEQGVSTEENLVDLRDSTEDSLLALRDDTQAGFDEIIDQLNDIILDYNDNVQESYGDLGQLSENALNESQKLFYESQGMPEGELMSPVTVRNVNSEGFEFLGYEGGMTIQWTARGLTQTTEDTDQTEEGDTPDTGDGDSEDSNDDGENGSGNGDSSDGDDESDDNGDTEEPPEEPPEDEDPTPRLPGDTPIIDGIAENIRGRQDG